MKTFLPGYEELASHPRRGYDSFMSDIPEFQTDWAPIPQSEQVTKQEREDAFGSYIMMFASFYIPIPLVEIPAAGIYYQYYKRKSRFVAFHALQSFLLQIPISLVSFGVVVWGIVMGVRAAMDKAPGMVQLIAWLVSMGLVVGGNIAYIVLSLRAAFHAKKGRITYLPWAGPLAYDRVFGPGRIEIGPKPQNIPPNEPPD
jgi:uncharacterized membrane protein